MLADTFKTLNFIADKVSDFTFLVNLLPFVFFLILVPVITSIIDADDIHILLIVLFFVYLMKLAK